MYHIIYKTTNLINDKIYIGYHATESIDVFDGYFGSGEALLYALKKYGRKNFKRNILYIFDNKEEALQKEKEIVDEEFVKRRDNYNKAIGGAVPEKLKGYKLRPKTEIEKQNLSQLAKERWTNNKEYIEKMLAFLKSDKRREYISTLYKGKKKSKEWIDKINKNPEKIRKTAEKHRGMKRSEEAKKNMSDARRKAFANGLQVHNKIEPPPKDDLYFLRYELKLKKPIISAMMEVSTVTLDKWLKLYGIF